MKTINFSTKEESHYKTTYVAGKQLGINDGYKEGL